MNKIYRQGDVLIQAIDTAIPENATKIKPDKGRVILAYGEVTGHAHALSIKTSTLYAWKGDRLLEVKQISDLTHEEHAPITLPKGNYKIIQQKEYVQQAIRNVAD